MHKDIVCEMKYENVDLALKLKTLSNQAGLTQQLLAAKLGITTGWIVCGSFYMEKAGKNPANTVGKMGTAVCDATAV